MVLLSDITWISGSYKEDHRFFNSELEAEEWTNALYSDFVPYIANKLNVGYASPDKKVIQSLEKLLPEWADYHEVKIHICKENISADGEVIFKVWTQQAD